MKKYFATTVFSAIIFISGLTACDKEVIYNGNVHITIMYKQNPVKGNKVYYCKGGLQKDSQGVYLNDGMQVTDDAGTANFYQLAPGKYTFYTTAYLPEAGRIVSKDTSLTVRARYRDESEYTFDLRLN
jgi:hypothetical protein